MIVGLTIPSDPAYTILHLRHSEKAPVVFEGNLQWETSRTKYMEA